MHITRRMAKFCANLSFMFGESPFLERYKLAKEAGFRAVESGFPFGFSVDEVAQAKNASGVEQILLNIFTGDVTKGELGFAAIPDKEREFNDSLLRTIEYAKALNVTKIHIMSGKIDGTPDLSNDLVYIKNLTSAAAILQRENLIGVIEPINKYSIPNYFMNSYGKALEVVKTVNSPHLKIMLDIFHMQHIRGDITHALEDFKPYTGHVQIAQNPGRNEPDTPGEINYRYVLKKLEETGYNDWIGLEYKPANGTVEGLKWITDFGYTLQ